MDAEGKTPETKPIPIDGKQFRQVLGHFATGVTVITADAAEGPVGMVANSFTSVSLDPPLVLFCPATASDTWPSIRDHGGFCVNVLNHEQEELAIKFSKKGIDRYEGVEHLISAHGVPRLGGAVAHLDCKIVAEHPAGDHVIVVGEVLELDAVDGLTDAHAPLIFHRGAFARLAS